MVPTPSSATRRRPVRALPLAPVLLAAALLAGCAQPKAPPPAVSVTDLTEHAAERTLIAALRAYDEADYPGVERLAGQALKLGLQTAKDRATAHKLRAFVACTTERLPVCETEFRAARAADPAFELSKAEAGHPLWGPVWIKVRH